MNITFTDYSEKAFVLSGDGTKEIKDALKEAKALYNPNLSVGKGWIFSKSKQQVILDKIKASGKTTFTTDEVIEMLKPVPAAE